MLGGGPAGAASAISLARRGFDVILLESTNFETPRFGETLPPEVNPVLKDLGVWDAFIATEPTPSPGIVSVWGSPVPSEQSYVSNRHGCGWHVDRNVFDSSLCSEAERMGARVRSGTRALRCVKGDGAAPWRIETSNPGEPVVHADFVIDATGRNAFRVCGAARRIVDDTLLAVFMLFPGDAMSGDLRTIIESTPDGWWYSAPLPSGDLVAAHFIDARRNRADKFDIVPAIRNAPWTAGRLPVETPRHLHLVHVPSSLRRNRVSAVHAAVGDAAAAFDPLSGYGIVKALRDGIEVAWAIEFGNLERYAADTERRFASYARQKRSFYASEQRWCDRDFWVGRSARP